MKAAKTEVLVVRGFRIKVEWLPNGNVYSYPMRKGSTDFIPYEENPHKLNAKKEQVIKDIQFIIDSAYEQEKKDKAKERRKNGRRK